MYIFENIDFMNKFILEMYLSLTTSLILRNPFTSLSEGLFSLGINSILTFSSHPSGFGISHTKDIISLDSSIDTTVSWNWLSILQHTLGLVHWFNSEESGTGRINILISSSTSSIGSDCSIIIRLSLVISILFFNSSIWNSGSIEGMYLSWWDCLNKLNKQSEYKL